MRVLWFTNTPCNYQNYIGYGGGGWLTALQDELCKRKDISLGVSFCMDGQACKVEQAETVYYPVQYYRKSIQEKLLDIIHIKDYRRDECAWAYYINNFKKVIEDFKPDVIEVFGSELYIGLATIAAKQLSIPCCLHVQGILSLYIYIFLTPGMSKWSYYLSNGLKNIYTNMQYIAYWKRSCYREKNILKAVPHVIGRTEWDKKAMEMLAPQAKYHYGGEILRACFYNHSERKLPSRAVISTTISNATYKGYDLLLKIANILKNELYLEFEWNVYGNVNPQTAELITNIKHKDVNVNIYGGRYGLSSKNTTPAHIKAIFDYVEEGKIHNNFTIGINDDVTNLSLDYDRNFIIPSDLDEYLFYGYGSDGIVSTSKDILKIIGDNTNKYVQG